MQAYKTAKWSRQDSNLQIFHAGGVLTPDQGGL